MIVALVIVLALIGVPLFAVLALATLLGFWRAELDPGLMVMEFLGFADHIKLAAVPLFAFCSVLILRSRLPERIHQLQQSAAGMSLVVGGVSSVIVFMLAGALTGVSILLLSVIAASELGHRARTDQEMQPDSRLRNAGLSSGSLIAPSAAILLLAVAGNQLAPGSGMAPLNLYLAGVVPALMVAVLLGGLAMLDGGAGEGWKQSPQTRSRAIYGIGWEFPLPLVVIGGIYSGWLDLLEAGLLATVWLFVVLVLIRGEVGLSKLPDIIADSVIWSASIILLLGLSLVAAGAMSDAGIPQQFESMMATLPATKVLFWLTVIAAVMMIGMLLEIPAGCAVCGPLLVSTGLALGINPVQLAIVILLALHVGRVASSTLCLRSASGKNRGLEGASSGSGVFLAAFLLLPFIIAFWPQLTLWGFS